MEDVDLTDGTAKLQSFVRMSAGPIREIKASKLPMPVREVHIKTITTLHKSLLHTISRIGYPDIIAS